MKEKLLRILMDQVERLEKASKDAKEPEEIRKYADCISSIAYLIYQNNQE